MKIEESRGTNAKQVPLIKSVHGRAAMLYAERFQFSVFPCKAQGKEPLTSAGCKDATLDVTLIKKWWEKWPEANVAVACGKISNGLLVLDLDGDEGLDSFRKFEASNGAFPLTPLSLTGKGEQLFFKTNVQVKNRVRLAPGVDIRTSGGYVIVPPSIHPNGRRYTWEVSARIDEVNIAEAPDWLIQMLIGSKGEANNKQDWINITKGKAVTGSRNANLVKLAGHLFRRFVEPNIVYRLLWAWNQSCTDIPLPQDEFDRAVNSIAGRELSRRKEGRT